MEENVSRVVTQNFLTPLGNNNGNFRLTRHQVLLRPSRPRVNDFFEVFFSIFELGGITKHLNDWSHGQR